MSKRSIGVNEKKSKMMKITEKSEDSNESKKNNFSIWKKAEEPISTQCLTPNTQNSKHDFNFWKKAETVSQFQSNLISTSELNFGMCLNRTLQFRVSFKSAKKSCKNGDMFMFHIADKDGEIQVTAFPQQSIAFFDLIEFNRTYQLTNFNVKREEANFPLFVGAGIYICLLNSSKIEVIDNNVVPELVFNSVPINTIKDFEPNSKCDVTAIIAKNWGVEMVGGNNIKRDLSLTDKSKEVIILTLWGSDFEHFDAEESVVIIHNALVKDFNDIRSLNCASRTLIWHDPDTVDAKDLKSWFDVEKETIQ